MKNKKTAWAKATNKRWKRVVIALTILIAIPAIPLGVAEYNDQQRAHKLVGVLDDFGQAALKPLGGVDLGSGATCSHVTDFLYSLESGPCPRAGGTWLVLIAKGHEAEFISTATQKAGYSGGAVNSWRGGVTKDDVGISIEVLPGVGGRQIPYAAPTGKDWYTLNLHAQ